MPESPWLAGKDRVTKPEATRASAERRQLLKVKAATDARFVVVRILKDDKWTTRVVGIAEGVASVPVSDGRVVVSVIDRAGGESEAVEVK